jgi:hypothetical protein
MHTQAKKASFIFHGTVVQPKASTMADQAPASANTAVVRVDDVVIAPPALAEYAGQDVTVLLQPSETVTAGEQATFYTNPSIFGDSLVVQSEGHQEPAAALRALAPASNDPVRNAADRDLQAHVAEADTIVTGTVMSTHLVSPPPAALTLAPGREPAPATRITEHDPEWHDAVVAVSSSEKGAAHDQVVVRYPNSKDVMWYRVPKLRPGMTGAFILHAAEPSAALMAPAALTAAPQAPHFVLLHPEDFQPHDRIDHVRAMIPGLPKQP